MNSIIEHVPEVVVVSVTMYNAAFDRRSWKRKGRMYCDPSGSETREFFLSLYESDRVKLMMRDVVPHAWAWMRMQGYLEESGVYPKLQWSARAGGEYGPAGFIFKDYGPMRCRDLWLRFELNN